MTDGLWDLSAYELLRRTASADPTPGGGSVAAVAGALGVALVEMAVAVSDDPALGDHRHHLAALQQRITPAADGDVADFTAVMAAFRLPRAEQSQRALRTREIERTSITATERPLDLLATLVEAADLAGVLTPFVKASIVSDVLAGRDLVTGAAWATVRTVDINLATLERIASPAHDRLRSRRNTLTATLEEIR